MRDEAPDPNEASHDPFELMAPRFDDFYPAGSRLALEFRFSRKLILTARRWVNLIDGTLNAATGQNRARWQTLFAIAFADPPVTTVSLSDRLSVRWPTLVRTLANLERDGLVQRFVNPEDGRSRFIELTDAGRTMLYRIQPVLDPTRTEVLQDLTDDQLREITHLLDRAMRRIALAQEERGIEDAGG